MKFFSSRRDYKAYRITRRTAAIAGAVLAVLFVTVLSVDLGPAVRRLAEIEASSQLDRPVHIGGLRLLVARGVVEVRDFSIEGLHPGDRPFFTASRLAVSLDWSKLLAVKPELFVASVDLADWRMIVEKWDGGADNFPKGRRSNRPPGGPNPYTTTLKYVHASHGQFAYEDHEAPWSVLAPDMDILVEKHEHYEGDAHFNGGLVSIEQFVPMWADFKAHFTIDGPHVHFDRIDVPSDGATTVASGDVDIAHFPEMTYSVKSHMVSERMREIFFANEEWPLTGESDFDGTFHLYKGGHDMAGAFTSPEFGLYDYRFPSMYGSMVWTKNLFQVVNAGSKFYGGAAKFGFSTKPLNSPERPTDRFEFAYAGVDVAAVSDFEKLAGQRFAGSASGRNVLEWRSGKFGEDHHGDGEIVVMPPPSVEPMIPSLAAERAADEGHLLHEWGPFAPQPLPAHLPISAAMTYRYDAASVQVEGGRFATDNTLVTFQGTTAWGDQSRLPFHVTSRDWQESDTLLAGLLTDFGSRKTPVAVGGRGEFDGVFTGPFKNPRVEGEIKGEDVRAWDTPWGEGTGHIVVQNGYVDVTQGLIRRNGSEVTTEGRFALGYPRDDHGEEIDARFRFAGRDIDSFRHAFEIDDYPVSGFTSGELHLTGMYQHMFGFGAMTIANGVAYGETYDEGAASLRFDGNGVRLDGATLRKATGNLTGSAYVGWDDTYSFNVDMRGVPMDQIALFAYPEAVPGGTLDFTAGGSGIFDLPRYDVRFRVNDLSVSGEPVGQMTGTFAVRGKELSGEFDAASPRMTVTGTGRIAITPQADSEMTLRFHDVALDPYVRLFVPTLSPYNSAVASGSMRVVGELSDPDHLLIDGTVDSLDMKLFEYDVKNAAPLKIALDHRVVRLNDLQLVGEDTRLRVSGTIGLQDQTIALQAAGDANLGILQGLFKDVRGSGRAELQAAVNGPLAQPVFSGSARVTNGRIRHFALPNSLDAINGTIQFDSRGIRLDDLSAMMGEGRVQFGGRIGLDGYLPGDFNVTVNGENMHLRVPDGMRSTIDANLAIRGNIKAPTLAGTIVVKSATFDRQIDLTGNLLDFVGGRSAASAGDVAEAPVSFPLRFDVEMIVPSNRATATLRFDNNVARMTASADLQLRGTYDHPQVFGHAEVDRGEVLFDGRRYLVTKGAIDFTNPTRIEPFFDVQAETRVRVPGETYRVTINLTGTMNRIQPSFEADPPLPTTDVVALLFGDVGRGQNANQQLGNEVYALQHGNERQTDVLATRATQLLASPISSPVGHAVEQTFGVDTFQLSPSLFDPSSTTSAQTTTSTRVNPAARVTIGKRISDRVYLTFSRSLASTLSDQILLLEYDASDRFSWILSRNEDNTYALEFSVRHTF